MQRTYWRRFGTGVATTTLTGLTGLLVSVMLIALVSGCGSEAVTGGGGAEDAPAELGIDLSAPYGGIDSGDEAPGFGDDYISGQLTEDEPVAVQEDDVPDVEDARQVLFLRAVWGRVAEPPERDEEAEPDCGTLVWDGNLSVSDGVIRPVSTVRFERSGTYADSLIFPRDDKQTLAWTSTTGCGQDGVVIAILLGGHHDSTMTSDGLTADDMVTFDTGPLTVSFPLTSLAELDSTILVDDENGVTFTGFDRDDLEGACRRGRLVGVWAKSADSDIAADRPGGHFRGAWLAPTGQLVAHMRGRWGTTDERGNLFLGKVIGANGRYEGHVRGMWEARPGAEHGAFRGRWVAVHPDRDIHIGGIKGVWGLGPDLGHNDGRDRGNMRGIWASKCNRNVDDDFGDDGDPGDGDRDEDGDQDDDQDGDDQGESAR